MLTCERSDDDDIVEIHGDRAGLLWLAEQLRALAMGAPEDHLHLLSEDWGGMLSTAQ